MTRNFRLAALALSSIALVLPRIAYAHGVVGDRFFPATLASDDPFAADELALPTVSLGNHQEDYDFEYSKSIFPDFAVSFGDDYISSQSESGTSGWGNLDITPMWQFETDADDEFVASAAVIFDIGGTGTNKVADGFTTYTPEFLFGKGFGDLPDSMELLRPIAVTGVIGYSAPCLKSASNAIEWSGAFEYSLLYLQNNVRDMGLGSFVTHLTPLIEFSMSSPTGASGGETTGTINPGLIWSNQYMQIGAEAVIPVNHASGNTVGALLQLHFYIDDIFPRSLGTPIFGGNQ